MAMVTELALELVLWWRRILDALFKMLTRNRAETSQVSVHDIFLHCMLVYRVLRPDRTRNNEVALGTANGACLARLLELVL